MSCGCGVCASSAGESESEFCVGVRVFGVGVSVFGVGGSADCGDAVYELWLRGGVVSCVPK